MTYNLLQKTLLFSLPVNLSASISILLFVGLSVLSFSTPFFLGYPQWLVGTIVNACLFLAAIFLPKEFILPIIIFPSLGVLFRGIIFGPLTMFLVYFLQFIWLANLTLVFVFKKVSPHLNYFFLFFLPPRLNSCFYSSFLIFIFNLLLRLKSFFSLWGQISF